MTDNRTTELLPCPFCGGEADVMLSQSRWGQSYTIHHAEKGTCPAGYVASMRFATEAEAIAAWNARAAYETDGYFLLPKPKERLYSLTETEPVFSDGYVKASFGVSVFDDAVKRWQHQIEENMERELLSRICEVFGSTRAAHGVLTAEQVREAIERHVKFYEGGDYDEQAIADELNARAERTCENTHENRWFKCSACGFGFTDLYANDADEQPRYCMNCGAKVVDA